MKAILLNLFLVTSLIACSNNAPTRGYTVAQIKQGESVFKANCQVCHGEKATGQVKEWQKPDASGKFPAPPLDGSAHAWHHSLKVLRATINRGGVPLGGTMPSFKNSLSEEDKTAVLAYILSLWPDDIYQVWGSKNN